MPFIPVRIEEGNTKIALYFTSPKELPSHIHAISRDPVGNYGVKTLDKIVPKAITTTAIITTLIIENNSINIEIEKNFIIISLLNELFILTTHNYFFK